MPTDVSVVPPTTHNLVWDLDGTLLDSFGMYVEAMQRVLPKHGRPVPSALVLRQHHHGTIEDTIREVAELTGPVTEDELAGMLVDFLLIDDAAIKDVEHHLFEDALRLMQHAHDKGLKQIIVTNRTHGNNRGNASPRTMVENSILKQYVDQIICGDDVTIRKPHWEVLKGPIDSGLAVPVRSLVIGDQYVDAELAQNLGCRAVLVAREGEIPHLDRLGREWQQDVDIVTSLDNVRF